MNPVCRNKCHPHLRLLGTRTPPSRPSRRGPLLSYSQMRREIESQIEKFSQPNPDTSTAMESRHPQGHARVADLQMPVRLPRKAGSSMKDGSGPVTGN